VAPPVAFPQAASRGDQTYADYLATLKNENPGPIMNGREYPFAWLIEKTAGAGPRRIVRRLVTALFNLDRPNYGGPVWPEPEKSRGCPQPISTTAFDLSPEHYRG